MWEREREAELWSGEGLMIDQLWYQAEIYPWTKPFAVESNGVALPRYGAYRRRSNGREHLVDVNTGFFRRSGEEAAVANFTGAPESLTVITVEPDLLEALFGEDHLPSGPFPVTPEVHFAHRLLVRHIQRDLDELDIEARTIDLVTAIVGLERGDWIRGARASTESSRRSLVNDACEVLHLTNGAVSLQELARTVGCSPFHLSRVFREGTGCTISQYRLRRRVHEVLDRLADGEDDLAALAVAVGFSDHSHMTRTVVAQLGEAPSALRRRLRP